MYSIDRMIKINKRTRCHLEFIHKNMTILININIFNYMIQLNVIMIIIFNIAVTVFSLHNEQINFFSKDNKSHRL
jgi:hypothetical protein